MNVKKYKEKVTPEDIRSTKEKKYIDIKYLSERKNLISIV